MKKSLKIFLSIVFVIVLFGIIFFIGNKKTFVADNNVTVQKKDVVAGVIEKDTDNDGLYDWEEELWNTDPNDSDTDQDGTGDSTEIKSGRNPLVAGPDDILKEGEGGPGTPSAGSQKELTQTEKLGRSMFGKYLSLKQAGVVFNEETTEAFTSEIIKENIKDFGYKEYNLSDLNNSKDESEASLRTFGNNLSDVINKNSPHTEHELLIFSRFSDSGEKKELENLTPIIASYKVIIDKERGISVPESAKEEHLAFINSLSFILSSLESMKEAENDPFIVVINIQRYMAGTQMLKESIAGLQNYFKEKNINFAQQEAGYGFIGNI